MVIFFELLFGGERSEALRERDGASGREPRSAVGAVLGLGEGQREVQERVEAVGLEAAV